MSVIEIGRSTSAWPRILELASHTDDRTGTACLKERVLSSTALFEEEHDQGLRPRAAPGEPGAGVRVTECQQRSRLTPL